MITGDSRDFGVYVARAMANERLDMVLAARNVAGLDRVASERKAPKCV